MRPSALALTATGLATGLLLGTIPVSAQERRDSDLQGWIQFEYQRRVERSLRGHLDIGYRDLLSTDDVFEGWLRVHMRGVFSYHQKKWLSFDGGLGGYYTFSDTFTDLFELRTWQGAARDGASRAGS